MARPHGERDDDSAATTSMKQKHAARRDDYVDERPVVAPTAQVRSFIA